MTAATAAVVGAPQPAFTTIMEARRNWINALALMVRSLRANGGTFRDAPMRILVPTVVTSGAESVESKGLIVTRSEPHPVIPYLNKLGMLEQAPIEGTTHLVTLDYDIMFLNLDKFDDALDGFVRARRKFKRHLRRVIGPRYDEPLVADGVRQWSRIDYLNTGVVSVPVQYVEQVGQLWRRWAERLMDPYLLHPLVDQVGFSIGIVEGRIPYAPLPARYNMTPGIGTDRASASMFHYSSSDPLNRHVRDVVMHSMKYFDTFLAATDSPTWTPFASRIRGLVDDEFWEIRSFLCEAVEEILRTRIQR